MTLHERDCFHANLCDKCYDKTAEKTLQKVDISTIDVEFCKCCIVRVEKFQSYISDQTIIRRFSEQMLKEYLKHNACTTECCKCSTKVLMDRPNCTEWTCDDCKQRCFQCGSTLKLCFTISLKLTLLYFRYKSFSMEHQVSSETQTAYVVHVEFF